MASSTSLCSVKSWRVGGLFSAACVCAPSRGQAQAGPGTLTVSRGSWDVTQNDTSLHDLKVTHRREWLTLSRRLRDIFAKLQLPEFFFLMELDFALLKYTIKYFLVYSQSCATITIMHFQNIFINPPPKKKKPGVLHCSLPQPLTTSNSHPGEKSLLVPLAHAAAAAREMRPN